MLLHLTGGELPSVGAFPNLVLATSPGAIAGNAEVLRAVLSALKEAQQAIIENPDVAKQALESAFPELSGPILDQGLSIYVPGVPQTPIITEEAYEIALEAFGLSGASFEQAVDNSLLDLE